MAQVREDTSEEISNWYRETRDNMDGVVVETNGGYFEYWIPVVDAPSYIDGDEVLSILKADIVEAPGEPNESQYDGTDYITIPEKVIAKVEDVTGVPREE